MSCFVGSAALPLSSLPPDAPPVRSPKALVSRFASAGSPKSVVIFTEPEIVCVSEAAIFSISFWAEIFGRSGVPALASAGTSPMVAAAMPAAATGTA